MWHQRSCYEQSNFVDVTIQCQLNVATRQNLTEFSTMYGAPPPSYYHQQQQQPSHHQVAHHSFPNARTPPSSNQCFYGNFSPSKPTYQCEVEARQRATADYIPVHSYRNYEGFTPDVVHSKLVTQKGYSQPAGFSPSAFGYNSSCMNDSGYGSPSAQPGADKGSYSPCVEVSRLSESGSPVFEPVKHTSGGLDLSRNTRERAASDVDPKFDSETGLSEEMKIAMREKDYMQRLFSLSETDRDTANEIEQYYHSQTSAIDLERHNVLSQMAYDVRSSESIHQYYNSKLMSLLECVDEKLKSAENKKCKGSKCKTNSDRKSRLLPKHAVRIMQKWYDENLENPYPSREVTLSMASEGDVTVEQIRKWFANKRNRSRNNKLKASDMTDEDL